MSDATLWINDADSTATITGVNVSYIMPLWVFEGIRDIIVTEVEKKAEVTYHDFDIQQELLDRYRADNVKLRELVRNLWPFVKAGWVSACPNRECCLFEECDADSEYECLIEEHMAGRMHELGIEV